MDKQILSKNLVILLLLVFTAFSGEAINGDLEVYGGIMATDLPSATAPESALVKLSNGYVGLYPIDSLKGKDGTSVTILGSLADSALLPSTGNTTGDGYLIDGNLWVWSDTIWINAGSIQGPQGPQGEPGETGLAGPNTVSTTTTTNISGVLKGNGSNVAAAVAGTDYQAPITGGASTVTSSNLASSMALVSNSSGKITTSTNITTTELEQLDGVSSNVQYQLNNKLGLHATADSALGALRLGGQTKTYYDTVGNGANRNRANHTGTQAISTIVNLQSTLDSKSDTNHNHLNDWTYIGVTHYNTSPYPKYWYNVYSLTGTGRGDEDIEVLYHGDANYYYGQCILRLKIVRYNGEPANQLHITVTPVSGWAANGLVKIDGGNVWVASSTIWGNIKARLVQSMYNPGRSLFGTTPTSTEPDGVRIDGTLGIRTFNGDAQVVMAHPLICSNAYVDGNQTITGLTASQIVETNTSKQLVSVAKGTAYNASYAGSGSATTVARSDHNHSGVYAPSTHNHGTGTTNTIPMFTDGSSGIQGNSPIACNPSTDGSIDFNVDINSKVKMISNGSQQYINTINASDYTPLALGVDAYGSEIVITKNRVSTQRRNLGTYTNITIPAGTTTIINLNSYSGVYRFYLTAEAGTAPNVIFSNAQVGDEIYVQTGSYGNPQMRLRAESDGGVYYWTQTTGTQFHLICSSTNVTARLVVGGTYYTGSAWELW